MKPNSDMRAIGYVRIYKSKSDNDIEYEIVNQKLNGLKKLKKVKHPPIHKERGNNKVLCDILKGVDSNEEVMLYVATIRSIGNTYINLINNLAEIREKGNVYIYFIAEEIDTSVLKIDSIIKLLENANWKTKEVTRGRPHDSLNEEAYSLFCELFPKTKSKTELAKKIKVDRSTIYRYIKRYQNQ